MNYKDKIKWPLILLVIVFCVVAYVLVYYYKNQVINNEIASITDYCQTMKDVATKLSPQGFEGVAIEGENLLQWKKVSGHIEIPEASEGADVWLINGRVVSVNMFLQARSTDWVNFSYYCYREDGSLAKLEGELNTFHADEGGVSVWSDYYYDTQGKEISASTTVYDLQTKDVVSNRNYAKPGVKVYKTVDELPFLHLISK